LNSTETLNGQHFDVVIIGAGVAGAMTGLLSSRAGLRTLLVDRQHFPRHKICGCCLNGRAVSILRQADLESGLTMLGHTTTTALSIRYRSRGVDVPMPANVVLSRRVLDHWLVNEAIAAGCRFVDDVSATMTPLPCDAQSRSHGAAGPANTDSALERTIELRPTAMGRKEQRPEASLQTSDHSAIRVYATVAVICDGLGHPSLQQLSGFQAVAKPGSRIGLGAVFPRTAADHWIRQDSVLMTVARHGYAGVVEIENQQLNLAASVDPLHLNQTKSPFLSLEAIFRAAGLAVPQELCNATIKGTIPLTRRAQRITSHRLLLLGDATGYVEPFTGEGMAWSLTAATAVVPLLLSAVRDGWPTELESRWQSSFRSIVRREQRICRVLSAALRQPWLLSPLMTFACRFPALTRRIVGQINRVPAALDSR